MSGLSNLFTYVALGIAVILLARLYVSSIYVLTIPQGERAISKKKHVRSNLH